MKTKKRKVKDMTFDLLQKEYELEVNRLIVGAKVGPIVEIFGLNEYLKGYMDDKKGTIEKLLERLKFKDVRIANKWEQINKVEDRYKRIKINPEPELMNTNFYCKNWTNAITETTCSSQCFDCIADIGEAKLKKI